VDLKEPLPPLSQIGRVWYHLHVAEVPFGCPSISNSHRSKVYLILQTIKRLSMRLRLGVKSRLRRQDTGQLALHRTTAGLLPGQDARKDSILNVLLIVGRSLGGDWGIGSYLLKAR